MSWVNVGVAAVGVAKGAYDANQAKKAAKGAASASQVDIDALDAQTRRIALQNAQDSAALEAAMTPEVPELRRQANEAVLGQVGTTAADQYSEDTLRRLSENPEMAGQTPLLQAAIAKAKADLAMGGRLDPSTRNAVARAALTKAGTVGSLGLGRDLTARDLGLTSMQVQQQRLENASRLGGQELQSAQYGTDTAFNNRANILNAIGALNQVQNSRFGRNLSAAQYGESIQRPIVGLDPGSVANIVTGNATNAGAAQANAANIYGQQSQNYLNLAGQFGSNALLKYNQTGGSKPPVGPSGDPSQPYS